MGDSKIAFVIPWYGEEASGGAESLCRGLAENLLRRGLVVEVLTTCARSFYSDWNEDYHAEGLSYLQGVPVRRFKVRHRDTSLFDGLNWKLMNNLPLTPPEEERFITEMINSDQLLRFLEEHKHEYLFFFIPYMFGTTYWGSRISPHRSYIIPCLHDESYARLRIYNDMFQKVRGVLFLSPPERELAKRLYGLPEERMHLVGAGMDLDIRGEGKRFRSGFGVKEPFLLYVGRKETGKNLPLLIDYFTRYRARRRDNLKLVLLGEGREPEGLGGEIVDLGFLSPQEKYDAYAAATVLCQPSVKESFSLALMEAWLCGTPALVHAHCAVTVDHCQRSNGGLYFADYCEFEACLDYLLQNPKIARRMGKLGGEYVRRNYGWDKVVERFVGLLGQR